MSGNSYNERLFGKGWPRKKLHSGRFEWLRNEINKLELKVASVLELGCFDGRSIRYLPEDIEEYSGYDANWENGLDNAISSYKGIVKYNFILCTKAEDFNPKPKSVDISVSLETLEHIALSELEKYLIKLAEATREYVFITVPNEKGLILFLKYFYKKWIYRKVYDVYSKRELWYATFGKLDKIERKEFGHKGFDYKNLIKKLENYFEIVDVKGIPVSWLPVSLNFTVGIIAKPKKL
ncbi:MAG: hypothetical protein IPG18_02680 [Saprospiraceae bacterium]|nr:hypothetical protein [Saprospiraceae bacterium]